MVKTNANFLQLCIGTTVRGLLFYNNCCPDHGYDVKPQDKYSVADVTPMYG